MRINNDDLSTVGAEFGDCCGQVLFDLQLDGPIHGERDVGSVLCVFNDRIAHRDLVAVCVDLGSEDAVFPFEKFVKTAFNAVLSIAGGIHIA